MVSRHEKNLQKVGELIRGAREQRDLRLSEAAKKLRMSSASLSEFEAGKSVPIHEYKLALYRVLGIKLTEWLAVEQYAIRVLNKFVVTDPKLIAPGSEYGYSVYEEDAAKFPSAIKADVIAEALGLEEWAVVTVPIG